MAAFARARPCCSGLRASLICCPAWQLVVVALCQLLIKTIIIIIIIIIQCTIQCRPGHKGVKHLQVPKTKPNNKNTNNHLIMQWLDGGGDWDW